MYNLERDVFSLCTFVLLQVNWDKELEEEAEKMKKKKKEAKQTSVTTSVRSLSTPPVIPQPLPKPQTITSSPKSTRSVVQQSTVDLLGMGKLILIFFWPFYV